MVSAICVASRKASRREIRVKLARFSFSVTTRPALDFALAHFNVVGEPETCAESVAAPVVLPASEIYPALERGVVDGAAWPLVGPYGFRWFEVSRYLMRPAFGRVGYPVFISLARWEALSQAERDGLAQAGADFEQSVGTIFDGMVATEEAALLREGMEVTRLSEARVETLAAAWSEGVLGLASRQNPDEVAEMTEIGRGYGMLP